MGFALAPALPYEEIITNPIIIIGSLLHDFFTDHHRNLTCVATKESCHIFGLLDVILKQLQEHLVREGSEDNTKTKHDPLKETTSRPLIPVFCRYS